MQWIFISLTVDIKHFVNIFPAKDKIDAQRRACRQTGGGPAPPSLSVAEESLSVCLGDRPGIHGVPGAVDSDGEYIQ